MLWTDIATWVGPTVNRSPNSMAKPPRGLVLHIASGFYDGTISWQKRTSGSDRTSSHFIVARDGRCAQMVDTADASWAQRSGNGTWLSVELEGFAPDDGLHATHPGWETATPQQIEVCARLLAEAYQTLGVPLQIATSPAGRGLGHHSMGAESGYDWGHSLCPGTSIKAQKPAILARAKQLAAGLTAPIGDDEMSFANLAIGPDVTSVTVPGGTAGGGDRDTYLALCNDTGHGEAAAPSYALRIWTTKGDKTWTPIDSDGLIVCDSGKVYSFHLPKDTRGISVKRMAIDELGRVVDPLPEGEVGAPRTQYTGPLSFALER